MKCMIGGRLYNTRTACRIALASYGRPGDFHSWEEWKEALYKAADGVYFVAGSGETLTGCPDWSPSRNRIRWKTSRSGGKGMRVLTPAEALDWCGQPRIAARHLTAHFPPAYTAANAVGDHGQPEEVAK